ncbi:hypothetical protein PHJA_002280000 [Phtheirospermum japonicum]|uniref:SLH domain-containing protein n=1 Tax=Phtheirospermum japonicum TaxID=374723 RepID=A0A830CNH6_9LAMI|nr:hypothetical protein PHJA_002280000 [Phtheirospermum japonicum]
MNINVRGEHGAFTRGEQKYWVPGNGLGPAGTIFGSKILESVIIDFDFDFSLLRPGTLWDYVPVGDEFYLRPRNPSQFPLSASVAEKNSGLEVSWTSWDKIVPDDYNGWAVEESASNPVKNKGLPTLAVIGVGTSVAAVIGLLAYFSFSNKGLGFRLRSPFTNLHELSPAYLTITDDSRSDEVSPDVLFGDAQVPEENMDDVLDALVATDTSLNTTKEQKLERIIIPFAVDSAQQESLFALKTLKIIEDDVKADELCTRREYARWLIRSNSQLERNRKHRINTSAALSGSRVTAFDDVGIDDPDFESIQSLAEAGVVKSKLSDRNGGFGFFPERFISRQDLISWKAKIEYKVKPGIDQEMSRKKIGFLDVKEISSDALVELYVDILADEKSIMRGVFGQSKRLQPSKPCTNGQAAVALSSGRMTKFVHAELTRLEVENISRQNEIKEITSELIERGDIKPYWEKKMEEEKNHGSEVEINYRAAITALEQEKAFQETALAETMKQKAALDCQEQLLSGLKVEIDDMSGKLDLERAKFIDEQREVEDVGNDLRVELEGLVDKKSILEAEVEALRILRSWVEDEARKSQARAKVLEEAGRRWKWDSNRSVGIIDELFQKKLCYGIYLEKCRLSDE